MQARTVCLEFFVGESDDGRDDRPIRNDLNPDLTGRDLQTPKVTSAESSASGECPMPATFLQVLPQNRNRNDKREQKNKPDRDACHLTALPIRYGRGLRFHIIGIKRRSKSSPKRRKTTILSVVASTSSDFDWDLASFLLNQNAHEFTHSPTGHAR